MLDHIGLRTTQFDTLVAFYKAVLAPLGYGLVMEFPGAAGFGRDTPDFAIGQAEAASNVHLAFSGKTRAEVDAFHAAALAHGGKDMAPPGYGILRRTTTPPSSSIPTATISRWCATRPPSRYRNRRQGSEDSVISS